MHNDQHKASLEFERLAFFSDAVFAIAITLLVLDLRLPISHDHRPHFEGMTPRFIGFAVSFIVIGIYWNVHHRLFGTLRRDDGLLRAGNLVFLASIVFLPFPTSVIAEYPTAKVAVMLYAFSVSAVGMLLFALTLLARRPNLTRPGETRGGTIHFAIRAIAAPAVFLISAALATAKPLWALMLWVLVWPAVWGCGHLGKRMQLRIDRIA